MGKIMKALNLFKRKGSKTTSPGSWDKKLASKRQKLKYLQDTGPATHLEVNYPFSGMAKESSYLKTGIRRVSKAHGRIDGKQGTIYGNKFLTGRGTMGSKAWRNPNSKVVQAEDAMSMNQTMRYFSKQWKLQRGKKPKTKA